MRLDEYRCSVCDELLPDSHLDWHSASDGSDVHERCCDVCQPRVHPLQADLFTAPSSRPVVSLDALRAAQGTWPL